MIMARKFGKKSRVVVSKMRNPESPVSVYNVQMSVTSYRNVDGSVLLVKRNRPDGANRIRRLNKKNIFCHPRGCHCPPCLTETAFHALKIIYVIYCATVSNHVELF